MTVATLRNPEVVDPDLTEAFESRLLGSLVRPNDAEYDDVRKLHNLFHDGRPAFIVRAADVADVIYAVNFARENELPLTVRSGGHSVPGYSMANGSVVVDMSALKSVRVDPVKQTMTVQPGATTADVLAAAEPHGLALSTGDTSTVGLGGLTTGGGIGFLVRKFGLTIDSLRSVNIVTASGHYLTANAMRNADLFWAIRGGSGNFGIVTSFTFKLSPVGTIYGGAIFLPATREVLRGYADYALNAPDELTTITNVMMAPPAPFIPEAWHFKPVFNILAVYAGDPETGKAVIAPLLDLAEPIAQVLMPMPYSGIYKFTAELEPPLHATIRSGFMDGLSDAVIERIMSNVDAGFDPFAIVQIRALGGAFGRVPNDATAFGHRDKSIFLALINIGAEDEHRQWASDLWQELRPHASGVYVNFLGNEGDDRVREAYPPMTYARLAGVKLRYDPRNLFNQNQNIRPAGAPEDLGRSKRFVQIMTSIAPKPMPKIR